MYGSHTIKIETRERQSMSKRWDSHGVGGGGEDGGGWRDHELSRAAESSWERRLALQWCRTTHTRPGLGLKLHLGTAWIARTA